MRTALHIMLAFTAAYLPSRAQTGVYLPLGSDIAVHNADTVAIFSNVRNEGRFGSLKGAVIDFYGSKWENGNEALLPDENDYNNTLLRNTGGKFRFLQAKERITGAQYIYGGYSASARTGASFPNLSVNNGNGVQLEDMSDLKIRHTLFFELGHVSLNGWNLVVGERYPGNITGYTENGFVITGTQPGGGFLYREQVSASDSLVVFPVGTAADSYSPIAVKNNGNTPLGLHARVFDSVYDQAINGRTAGPDYVQKTWNIVHDGAGNDLSVWLQYNRQDEGVNFALNRDSSYVASFAAAGWDSLPPSRQLGKGLLTTGDPRPESYMNYRRFSNGLTSDVYLSLSAHNAPKTAVRRMPWLVQVNVFPNPSNGNFNITFFGIQHKLRMVMYDMSGREQGSWILSGDTRISRTGLPAGLYILTFYDTENNNAVVNNIKMEIF